MVVATVKEVTPLVDADMSELTNCMAYRGSEEGAPRGAALLSILRVRDYFETSRCLTSLPLKSSNSPLVVVTWPS
jgi:hypothetical protein